MSKYIVASREGTKMSTEAEALVAALKRVYKEGLGVDYALVCQGEVKMVHSQVLGMGCINLCIL